MRGDEGRSGGERARFRDHWRPWKDFFTGTWAPALTAGASVGLLLTFVVRDSGGPVPDPAPYRVEESPPRAIVRLSPSPEAEPAGDLSFSWESIEGAIRYWVTLADPVEGTIREIGSTDATRLAVPRSRMGDHFPGSEPRILLWTVRARLLDGTEISSDPGSLRWTPPAP
jgi:hypothetical protein